MNLKTAFTLIFIISAGLFTAANHRELQTTLKEDYYREMALSKTGSVDEQIAWLDSLLSVPGIDRTDIQIKKLKILQEAGRFNNVMELTDKLIKNSGNLPLHRLLPLLHARSYALYHSNGLFHAMTELKRMWEMPKPDSLLHWDIRVGLSIFNNYLDLQDIPSANEWLRKTEAKLSEMTIPDPDATAAVHGARATMLIIQNHLDSAYAEVKTIREIPCGAPIKMGALVQTAQIYMAKGQLKAARQYLEQALSIDSDGQTRRTAIYMLAQNMLYEKDFTGALRTLDSYPRETVKSNSIGNLRAYYILRGQAYAGIGNMTLAYNSLDSALVVGDTILAQTTQHLASNARRFLHTEHEAADARASAHNLTIWLSVLTIALAAAVALITILLRRNFSARKTLSQQRSLVEQARDTIAASKANESHNLRREDDHNRQQTSLLLKLANLETTLDAVRRKLSASAFTKADRDAVVRQLNSIAGKEKMWELFSLHFEMTNRRFLDLLSERHPDLTKSEKRICAFMLLNLSTKEIAGLLDRSPRTIDVTRYNLRKKLGIDIPTENYLHSLAAEAQQR